MTMRERIKELCVHKGTTFGRVEKDLGFAKGYLSKLDNTTPSGGKLHAMAEYFGVTVEYLLRGEVSPGKYYMSDQAAQIAQEVFDNPDLRLLLDAAKDVRPENIRLAAEMLRRFKVTNPDA